MSYNRTRGRFYNRFNRVKPKHLEDPTDNNHVLTNSYEKSSFGVGKELQDNQQFTYNGEEQVINNQLSVIPEERQFSAAKTPTRLGYKNDRYSNRMTPENPPQNFDAAQLDEIANPLETDKKSQIDYNSPNIYASEEPNFNVNVSGFLKYQKKNDLEINVPENPKQNNVQQINSIRKRGYGRPLNASKFEDEIKNNQAVMQFIQKLEYQKSLEYQMLERHLKKSNEQKVQQLEERIEELKFSRDQFKKELERKSASPETNNIYARKPVFNESSEFTRKPDKHSLRKSHFTPTKQAAPPQEISNNSASSKKNFGTQDTYGSRDPMNDTSEYNNVYNYLQLQNEFSKMREELRENTERLQKEISDSRVN